MFIQLGNHIFEKVNTPESFTRNDETTFAEHALINGKPRLQPSGNNLEEISLSLRMRAENVDITRITMELKASKDEFEVLPLVMGTGRYMGNFVIISMGEELVQALEDGTPIEVVLNIELKEFEVPDKLQQQQNAARKNAFAAGDKKPVRAMATLKHTPAQTSTIQLRKVGMEGSEVDRRVRLFEGNPSQQLSLGEKIQKGLQKMDGYLTDASTHINTLTSTMNPAAILAAIASLKSTITTFTYPITSAADLRNFNTQLQANIRTLRTASSTLINQVITRRA